MEDALMYDEEFDGGDDVNEGAEESTRLKILRKVASFASKFKEIIGNIIATAGKVVVTIFLGITGWCYAVYLFTLKACTILIIV